MWTLRQTATGWEVINGAGEQVAAFDGEHVGYSQALTWLADFGEVAPAPTVDDTAGNPPEGVLVDRWVAGPNGIVLAGPTDDGRDFTGCVFTWRPAAAPLPLMFLSQTTMGHMEAQLAGFIDAQGDPTAPAGAGGWFHDSDIGRQARDAIRAQGAFFCSVDPGLVTATFVCTQEETDDWGTYCADGVLNFEAYEIAGVTLVPFPAFAMATIELEPEAAAVPEPMPVSPMDGETIAASADPKPVEAVEPAPPEGKVLELLKDQGKRIRAQLAASAPLRPPAEWFTMGEPDDSDSRYIDQRDGQHGIPLTITDDGHVYGHAGLWGSCHVGYLGECVTPPTSNAAYAHFHVGVVQTDDGSEYATGTLTAGCDHAVRSMRAAAAQDYYAHNGVAWGDARASNGRHGVWMTGTLRPDVTEEQVRVLRAGSVSGDWRGLGRGLEMIGLLAVSVPGFPIVREALAASGLEAMSPARLEWAMTDGRMSSLVASGVVYPREDTLGALVAAGTIEICANCGKTARRPQPHLSDRSNGEVVARLARIEAAVGIILGRTEPLLAQAADVERARLALVARH